jgi:hypothetical protein
MSGGIGTSHVIRRIPESFPTQDITFSNFFQSSLLPTLICTAKDDLITATSDRSPQIMPDRRKAVTEKCSRDLSLWAYPEYREAALLQPFLKEVST